jgi:hypothetical protein
MNQFSSNVAERECVPGELMRMVADGLTAHGFEVRIPVRGDERRLTITSLKDTRCAIIVEDWGEVELEYRPPPGHDTDPALITRLVKNLLASSSEECQRTAGVPHVPGLSLIGIVGREARAAGLEAELDVCQDRDYFEVSAEIIVTNPRCHRRGQIRVSGDGGIRWACNWREDGCTGYGEIAETVASILARELAVIGTAPGTPRDAGDGQARTGGTVA